MTYRERERRTLLKDRLFRKKKQQQKYKPNSERNTLEYTCMPIHEEVKQKEKICDM